jgi:hypothetical protein
MLPNFKNIDQRELHVYLKNDGFSKKPIETAK